MNELIKVREFIEKFNMIEKEDSVIVGISGGADSVCLYKMLLELREYFNIDIVAVHIHHGIRGMEADRDMGFVKDMCASDGVKFRKFEYNVPEYAKENSLSEEEAGRILRYKAFNQLAEEIISDNKKVKIAVAHNRNDSAETFIHNMCRGSGLKGLAGISYKTNRIIRPVLCLTRKEIENYLLKNDILYINDSTNFTEDYTRNKIRIRVLPYLQENINDNSLEHICQAADEVREAEEYLSEVTRTVYENIVSEYNNCVYINKRMFNEQKDIIRKRVIRLCIDRLVNKLKDITKQHIEDVLGLCSKQTGKYVMLPYGITAKAEYDNIVLRRADNLEVVESEEKQDNNIEKDNIEFLNNKADRIEIKEDGIYTLGENEFEIRIIDTENSHINIKFLINHLKKWQNLYTKCFDYDKIQFTVQLRYRETEDYFVINKAGNRKKLKSFFIDNKIVSDKRKQIPLFADGSHIMWIVGYRISEKYKITEDTKRILIISRKEKN